MLARVIAAAVEQRRKHLSLSQEDLAAKAGVGLRTVQYLEAGRTNVQRITDQLKSIERALGWAPGSLVSLRNGGDPTLVVEGADQMDPREVKIRAMPYLDDREKDFWVAQLDLPAQQAEILNNERAAQARKGA